MSISTITKKLSMITAGAAFVTLGATNIAQAVTLGPVADSYIQDGGSAGSNFGNATTLQVKNANTASYNRKAYVRFDLASLAAPAVNAATFSLSAVNGIGSSPGSSVSTFNVYGLTGGDQTWGETAITWNNAPANITNSGSGVDLTQAQLLGSFDITGTGTGNTYSISGSPLVSFLNARLSGNDLATLIVTRVTSENTIGNYVHAFDSSNPASGQPILDVTPVPFGFSPTLGLGLLGAFWGASSLLKRKRIKVLDKSLN